MWGSLQRYQALAWTMYLVLSFVMKYCNVHYFRKSYETHASRRRTRRSRYIFIEDKSGDGVCSTLISCLIMADIEYTLKEIIVNIIQ
jgi:hypothetical protein